MYDTLLHTQLADGQTVWSVFLPNEQFGFYRPLVFLPIVLFQNLLGHYPVFLFHLINVVTHGLNAALVARLVWRLGGERWQALTAGLLFATFPFAYQALAIYGNNPYLTATFFMLLGVNLAINQIGRRDERSGEQHLQQRKEREPAPYIPENSQLSIANGQFSMGWFALPLVFLCGVLVHETAVLLVPFVLFLDWVSEDDRSIPKLIRKNWLLIVVCAVYLSIYPFLPRGGGPLLDFGGNELTPKILLFLQTAAWPTVLASFQMISGRLAILLGFALLAGWVGYTLTVSRSKTLLLGIVWFVLASLLVGITLPTYYIEDGARLLYPAGVGVAIIWAVLISPNFGSFKNFRSFAVAIVAICLISIGSWFNWRMIGLYEMGSRPIHTLNQVVADTEPDSVLLVNLPQWMAWPNQVFPAGTEFAPVMGSHLFALELVRANTGQTPEIIVLDVPESLATHDYSYGVYRLNSVAEFAPAANKTTQVIAAEYTEGGPLGRWRGTIWPGGDDEVEWSAGGLDFGPTIACNDQVIGMTLVNVEMTYRPHTQLGDTQSFFVQALDQWGGLIAQNDGPPVSISPGRLKFNDRVFVTERRQILAKFPADSVLVGVYDFATGERAEAVSGEGKLLPANAYKLEVVSVCSDS